MEKPTGEELLKRYDALDGECGTIKNHWQEIVDYMLPTRGNIITRTAMGAKRTAKIFDGTATRALRIFANGLYGHLTTPSSPWFALSTRNKEALKDSDTEIWLRESAERMHAALAASNFGRSIHEVYTDLGALGTAPLFLERDDELILNFTAFCIGSVRIAENANGVVDTVLRKDRLTVRQVMQRWPDEAPEHVKKEFENGNVFAKIEILHACMPREDRDPSKRDRENMAFAGYYVDIKTKEIIHETGYRRNPYMVPRLEKDSDEVMGRSLGMDALPDVKQLNRMSHDDLRAIQKMIDPPIAMRKETSMSNVSTVPGSILYYKGDQPPHALQSGGNYQIAVDAEEKRRQAIMQTFYADLFMLLAQKPGNDMTATEVLERVEEKLILLGPILGRLQNELFDPVLANTFWILLEEGIIAPPPRALVGSAVEIEYINKLALAMRAFESNAMQQTVTGVIQLSQSVPEIRDNVDFDKFAQGLSKRNGTPLEIMNTPKQVVRIRQLRAQAQAKAQQDAQLMEAAKAIPMGKAVERNSPLDLLSGGQIAGDSGGAAGGAAPSSGG